MTSEIIIPQKNELRKVKAINELAKYPHWIMWRQEQRNGQSTKIPTSADGYNAKTNDASTWTNFNEAVKALEEGNFDGIGYVFTDNDPFFGIDLDHCRNPETGEIAEWATMIINSIYTYAEVSVSGTGLHLIGRGELPGGRNRTGEIPFADDAGKSAEIEMYDKRRFFTITGELINEAPDTINDMSEEIRSFYQDVFPHDKGQTSDVDVSSTQIDVDGVEVLEAARNFSNAKKFNKLWNGEWQDDYPSQSEADQALCNMLAFAMMVASGGDVDKNLIDKLFRQSDLNRSKWEERQDYRNPTINKAVALAADRFDESKTSDKGSSNEEDDPDFRATPLAREFLSGEKQQGYHWKYVAETEKFYFYNDDTGVWMALNDQYVKKRVRKFLMERQGSWDTNHRVSETLSAIKAELASRIMQRRFDPGVQPIKDYINVENGMLEWRTGKLLEHDPEYYSQWQLPVKYDPDAECPRFKQALDEWIIEEDNATKNFLQEFIGYCLIPDTSLEKMLILTGTGANGKSTLLETLYYLFGRENLSNIPLHKLTERFGPVGIKDKLVNICPDIDPVYIDEIGIVKAIVSGEPVQAEEKNKPSFRFHPVARLIFSANEIPKVKDTTDAFYRRFEIIEFDNQFKPTDPIFDPHLKDKLKEETPGILNWAVKGLQRLKERGRFKPSGKMQGAKQEYEIKNDSVKAFIEEQIIRDDDAHIHGQRLYKVYTNYCENFGLQPVSRKKFTQRLRQLGFTTGKRRVENSTSPQRCYIGLRLR